VLALPGELLDALREYAARANASPRVRRTLTGWTCRLHIQATDTAGARFTLQVAGGQAGSPAPGLHGVPDLVVRGHSMDLAEIFRGDANPVSNYMQGAIKTQAAPMT
jgi:SCP-2 sterol transfer family